MASDPWADEPVAEPPKSEPPAPSHNNHDNHSEGHAVSDTHVNASLKAGSVQGAPWTTFEAPTPEDLLTLLGGDPSGKSRTDVILEVLKLQARMTSTYAAEYQKYNSSAPSASSGGSGSSRGGSTSGRPGEPSGTQEKGNSPGNCDHGIPYEFAQGVNKTTKKPYAGWYCQAKVDRSDKCKPVYVD